MTVFVFVSGYFGKSERSHSFPAIIKLIFLYFIFNSIMGLLYGFTSLLSPMYSYWYLLALIAWRLTAHHIAKFKEIQLILLVTSLFVGFYPSIDNSFAAARIIGFYPFYMAGYLFSHEKFRTELEKPRLRRILIGSGSLLAAGALAFVSYGYFAYSDEALQMSGYAEPIDAAGRIALYLISFLMIYALRHLTPNKEIPLLTMFGRNSLWIFLLHRPLTLIFSSLIQYTSVGFIIVFSVVSSLTICILFGNDPLTRCMDKFANAGKEIFTGTGSKLNAAKLAALGVALCFIFSVVFDFYKGMSMEELKQLLTGNYTEEENTENNASEDILYSVMTQEEQSAFEDALHITFAGDLILLEDQVKRGFKGEGFDFSDVFAHAQPYISSADFAIGVFEGPLAGEEAGYSSGNFDDGKSLYLNYPDEFAHAVKAAGFDLVTTANNHLLDKGVDGAMRTLDVLDEIGLAHTGSYRSEEEKEQNRVKLLTLDGIRIAILSYTYGSNYINNSNLISGKLSYITSVTPDINDPDLETAKNCVIQDFEQAKALSPDLIMVLPHMGEQFSNTPDENQEMWFSLFKECGADIILGDHPHVVEPAVIEEVNGRKVFTAYCPGNFANIYRKQQGDTSMLVDVYIDRSTKKIIGGGIVPLYTQAPADGNYRALPIYEIMHNPALRSGLSTDDIER
ncbi:MAG: CapA family protein, partial [Oscillospiraceae bacterium]|nr:CapA family protein [Oscillospiraceae bacterium]